MSADVKEQTTGRREDGTRRWHQDLMQTFLCYAMDDGSKNEALQNDRVRFLVKRNEV